MPLLIEKPSKNIDGDICPICNKPMKDHTVSEVKNCSEKLRDIEKSGRWIEDLVKQKKNF